MATRSPEYVVLIPGDGTAPSQAEVNAVLADLGFRRWEGDGLPSLVVFSHKSGKGDYFEAGYWAGAGVPVFFLGGGHGRTVRRGHLVQRFRGWRVAAGLADLPAVILEAARHTESLRLVGVTPSP